MVINDVVANKAATIENCVKRIHEEYANAPNNLKNLTKQDSVIMNMQRACEACIDLAMHVVSEKKLGAPRTSRDAFQFLSDNRIIDQQLSNSIMNMNAFRNQAVHDDQSIDLTVMQAIIENHLTDFTIYTKTILSLK